MVDLKRPPPQRTNTDDLSDAGSERAEIETLNEEELPSYPHDQPATTVPPEKSAPNYAPAPNSAPYSQPTTSRPPLGPTASAPFNFPTADLPSYETAVDFRKPLAIPQCFPSPDAPFVSAYPTDLLSYGIPAASWHSFVDTLSAFLSAKISQQALHHATDVAKSIQDYHKQYVTNVKRSFSRMGKSAKHFNPFGVVGGAIGLTFGTVGHTVGAVVNTPFTLIQKPKTPRERATVYIAAANKDWFHQRGLHALLLDTVELAHTLGLSHFELLAAVRGREMAGPFEQLASLRQWIGDVQGREDPIKKDETGQSTSSLQAEASSSRLTPTSSRQSKGKSSMTGDQARNSQLQLGPQTLWLVVTQEKNVQAVEIDEKGRLPG